jgi:fermentation-respiration switch protein FrsA (DUF1100 family)
MMFLENRLLFYPIRASADWEAPPNARVQDVYLQTAADVRIHAWWCPVAYWEPAQGALLYCHGNAGNLSYRAGSVSRWQKELGQSVLIFDYPGFGQSEGRPDEAGCYAAANAAYDWLTQAQEVPPERILLYGGSLGGGVAVELASHRPHRALILAKTFTSIPDAAQSVYPWLPARWLVRSRFDNLAKIRQCSKPVFIAHGTADQLIPFTQGERLFAAANEPKQFLAMRGVEHNGGLSGEFYSALRDFLARAETPGR